MLRRLAALFMLGLGLWLGYGGVHALSTIMNYGSDLSSALLDPPTTLLRLMASGLMVAGGLMAALKLSGGGVVALVGAGLFMMLGGLMALSGADSGMWMDEVMYGVAAIGVAVFMLTLKRA